LVSSIKHRLDKGKLTFYMSERWWKPPVGVARLLNPRFAIMTAQFRKLASSPYFHYLSIGDYAAVDMKRVAQFPGRMWRWGYFTTLPNPLPLRNMEDDKFQVLWAGRMLGWKRVDTLIRAFSPLLRERPDAILTLVGDGPERKRLQQLAKEILTSGSYRFIAPLPVAEVLQLMRQHNVYVLPSNAYEGWGAVINEAMAEGCIVMASEAAGAAKSVIRHGENGLLFAPGDWKKLSELLCHVASNEMARIRLVQKGQRTMTESWSPILAAKRFLSVCKTLLMKQPPPVFSDGPMTSL